jgi:peroxiredoxin
MSDSINRLKTGQRLANFSLPDLRNKPVSLTAYRRRSNLVVVFSGHPVPQAFTDLLDELAEDYHSLDEHEAEVLAVLPVPHAEAAVYRAGARDPFPVLIDAGGDVHRQAGAVSSLGEPAFTVAILDRYGEIYGLYWINENTPPPSIQDIKEWLAYIELQCDE